MGKIGENGLLAVPTGKIIGIRGGFKKKDHAFCIKSESGAKWIAANTIKNWRQLFGLHAGKPGDHMNDEEYKADSGKREKNGKGRKVWLHTCRLCRKKYYRHIYDHYGTVHGKVIPPCFFCGALVTKNNMWKHVHGPCKTTSFPQQLKSLSIQEVDLMAGCDERAKEILAGHPKAVMMLPFYHEDPEAGEIRPSDKVIAARARRAAVVKAKLPPKKEPKPSTSATARISASKPSPSSLRSKCSSLAAAAAKTKRKRRSSGASDTQSSPRTNSKKKLKYDQNGKLLQVTPRTGKPIGKEEAQKLKQARQQRALIEGLNIVTVPPAFYSIPGTNAVRINMKKLPFISIRMDRIADPVLIGQSCSQKTRDLGGNKQNGSDFETSLQSPAPAIANYDEGEKPGIVDSTSFAADSCESDDRSSSDSPPLCETDRMGTEIFEAEDVDSSASVAGGCESEDISIPNSPPLFGMDRTGSDIAEVEIVDSSCSAADFSECDDRSIPNFFLCSETELRSWDIAEAEIVDSSSTATDSCEPDDRSIPNISLCSETDRRGSDIAEAKIVDSSSSAADSCESDDRSISHYFPPITVRARRACKKAADFCYMKPTMVCGQPGHAIKCQCFRNKIS